MGIFKDCDIRGTYPDEINQEIAYLIGRAVAAMVPERSSFAVGGDVRQSTPTLKKHLIDGLIEGGIEVVDVGTVPTPLLYFAVDYLQTRGGIMVTASHNPAQYNGFKILLGKMPITPQDIKEIRRRVQEKDFRLTFPNVYREMSCEEPYFLFLNKILNPPQKKLKVVVDCGNGCYAGLAPQFFTSFGYDVIPLFCTRDGNFPNREPNPSQPANLKKMVQTIRQNRAHVGVAFDGDGDRVVFADEKGQIIPPEHGMIFFLRHILPHNPPGQKFVYDIKSSKIIADEVKRLGGIPLVEKSGHTYIKTRLIKENAIMAGEISGHYFFREIHRDDGLFAATLFLSFLSSHDSPLSTLIQTYPSSHVTPDIRIRTSSYPDLMNRLEKSLSSENTISKIDGIRVEWPEGWGLLRKSVTEPVFTLRFEAAHQDLLPQIVHRFLQPFPEIEKEVLIQLNNNRGATYPENGE